MNMKRFLSAALSLVMAFGAFVPAAIQPVSAAWEDKVNDDGEPLIDYVKTADETAEAKMADMIMVKEQNGCQIWYEEFTGEIAVVDTVGMVLSVKVLNSFNTVIFLETVK